MLVCLLLITVDGLVENPILSLLSVLHTRLFRLKRMCFSALIKHENDWCGKRTSKICILLLWLLCSLSWSPLFWSKPCWNQKSVFVLVNHFQRAHIQSQSHSYLCGPIFVRHAKPNVFQFYKVTKSICSQKEFCVCPFSFIHNLVLRAINRE